ncbi:MAG TPA: CsbD family protein [Microterricola sp.]
MAEDNKIKNAAEETVGKMKEGIGEATGNESLANKGRMDQAKANVKQAGEKVKDAVTDDD